MAQGIRYEADAGVASIRLAMPNSGNALSTSLLAGPRHCLTQAMTDESCRVITISAEGPDFCKGLDLEEAFANGRHPDPGFLKTFLDCAMLICDSSRPVIASVEGNVTGGGIGLVAACDLVLATQNVTFMLSEVLVGMIPALITPFLLRRMASARIGYLTLSTRGINAQEAHVFGLVDEIAEDEMENTLHRQLQRLLRSSPSALAASKRYFNRFGSGDLQRQTEIAIKESLAWVERLEVIEGVRTFCEGFSPPWFHKHRRRRHV